jgi:hypothetical protein
MVLRCVAAGAASCLKAFADRLLSLRRVCGSLCAGPGTYSAPYEVGKEAPKYSMTGRGSNGAEALASPGPGAYQLDPNFGKAKLAASMKSRHYDKADAFAPGPGAYKLADSIGNGHAPAYTMRPKTNPRNSAGPQAVPGPGAYSLATSIGTAPAKSMTARREAKAASEQVPGPGSYALADSIGGKHAPAYTLRPKTNIPADLADSPGPGAYNHDTQRGKGPKITMAPKLDIKGLTDAVPGQCCCALWRSATQRSSDAS